MTVPMTDEECRIATEALSPQLDRYAALIVRKGCAIKPGQQLVVTGPIERADFMRRVVRAAYESGSGSVTVIWDDDEITRLTFEHNDLEFFENVPEWKRIQLNSLAEDGAAFLRLEGEDPMKLKGIDPMKPAVRAHAVNTQCETYRRGMQFGLNVWCIVGVPVAKWASPWPSGRRPSSPTFPRRRRSIVCGSRSSPPRAPTARTPKAIGRRTTHPSRRSSAS